MIILIRNFHIVPNLISLPGYTPCIKVEKVVLSCVINADSLYDLKLYKVDNPVPSVINVFWFCQTQPGLSSRGPVTLAHSESGEEGLHSTTPVYPSWDGNYGLGEPHHHRPAKRREGGTRPPSAPPRGDGPA